MNPLVIAPADPPTVRALDLNTAHMPESDPDFGTYEVGTFSSYTVIVSGLNTQELNVEELDTLVKDEPEWLQPILKLAAERDCLFISFSPNAPIYPLLPVYDW